MAGLLCPQEHRAGKPCCPMSHSSGSIAAMTDGATVDVADEQILNNQIIRGLKTLIDRLGCSLHEALAVFAARYEVLRAERPCDFVCRHA